MSAFIDTNITGWTDNNTVTLGGQPLSISTYGDYFLALLYRLAMLSELETPVVFTETPVSLGVAMVTWGDVITDVSGQIVYIIWVRAYGNEYSSLTNASFVSAVSNHLLYSKARFFGSLALREGRCIYSMSNNPTPAVSGVKPVNTKHLYNICTLGRRCTNGIQIFGVCWEDSKYGTWKWFC